MIDLDSLDGISTINDLSDIHTLASKPSSQSDTAFSSTSREIQNHSLTCMLITANVGTIFEEVSRKFNQFYQDL